MAREERPQRRYAGGLSSMCPCTVAPTFPLLEPSCSEAPPHGLIFPVRGPSPLLPAFSPPPSLSNLQRGVAALTAGKGESFPISSFRFGLVFLFLPFLHLSIHACLLASYWILFALSAPLLLVWFAYGLPACSSVSKSLRLSLFFFFFSSFSLPFTRIFYQLFDRMLIVLCFLAAPSGRLTLFHCISMKHNIRFSTWNYKTEKQKSFSGPWQLSS